MMTKAEYRATLTRMLDEYRKSSSRGEANCRGLMCGDTCPLHALCVDKTDEGKGTVNPLGNAIDIVNFVEKWGRENPIVDSTETYWMPLYRVHRWIGVSSAIEDIIEATMNNRKVILFTKAIDAYFYARDELCDDDVADALKVVYAREFARIDIYNQSGDDSISISMFPDDFNRIFEIRTNYDRETAIANRKE